MNDVLFFAGEAAHNGEKRERERERERGLALGLMMLKLSSLCLYTGMNMCMHGAMEAGQRAATQIMELYNQRNSKL